MKAFIYEKYGPPSNLRLSEVEKPEPKEGEVLIKVHATALSVPDWRLMRGTPFMTRLMAGLMKPKYKILGTDVSGIIDALGKNVTGFKVGDAVYGDLSGSGFGAFAEYVCTKEDVVAHKPSNLSFEEAASMPLASVTALQAIRDKGQVREGHKVLIIGASGGVGSFAIQIAKSFRAEVTAVCSTRSKEQALEFGADHVIDYTQEELSHSEERYDVIVAVNGYYQISTYRKLLNPKGRFVMVGGLSIAQVIGVMAFGPLMSMIGDKKFAGLMAMPSQRDLAYMAKLAEEGKTKSIVEKQIGFSEIPEGLGYLEKGHAKGKVVVKMDCHDQDI